MRRFFVPPDTLGGDEVHLEGEVFHHLSTVLRLGIGDEILLLDGEGVLCRCRIQTLGKREGKALVLARWREAETAFPIQLLQSLPKGDKMELVLQKGTELGISAFTPLLTERSIPRYSDNSDGRRFSRWERIVREAARQCRRPFLPRLDPPLPLEKALASCTAPLRLMLWEEESRLLAAALPPAPPKAAALLVGPEGGFSSREAQQARDAGFLPVSLGPRILRSESAGFAVASILQYVFGDLGRDPGQDSHSPTAPRKENP